MAYQNFDLQLELIEGRQALTGVQIEQQPWLKEYIAAHPGCFERALDRDCLFYYPRADAPAR